MNDESKQAELRSLASAVKEHITYLRELGIERTETEQVASETRSQPAAPSFVVEEHVLEPLRAASASLFDTSSADRPATQETGRSETLKMAIVESRSSGPTDSLFESEETLEDIWRDIGDCTRCPLATGRTHVVHSEGNRRARLMFVGEAPGADEDAQARPFVGRAGQLLNKIIEGIGFRREDVFIGNVNRCRPEGNRTPTLPEAHTCRPFLLREIAAVRPSVIVVLGNTAMKNLLEAKEGITRLRGIFQEYKGIKVMPTFHPAYLLRDPSKKRETWDDMKKVRDYLKSIESDEQH